MKQKKNSNLKRAAGPQKRPAAPAQAEQTPRSRDEIRREQQLRSLKKRRRKKAILYLVLFLLLLCVGAVLTFTVFFHIADFEVKGNSRYQAQEVIEASGIAKGENLFLCKTEQAAGRIAEKLPYVESVTIKRKLPDKLVITVKEAQLKLAVQQGNSYLIMTGSGKVLEIGATELPEGAALLKGVEVKAPRPVNRRASRQRNKRAKARARQVKPWVSSRQTANRRKKRCLTICWMLCRRQGFPELRESIYLILGISGWSTRDVWRCCWEKMISLRRS